VLHLGAHRSKCVVRVVSRALAISVCPALTALSAIGLSVHRGCGPSHSFDKFSVTGVALGPAPTQAYHTGVFTCRQDVTRTVCTSPIYSAFLTNHGIQDDLVHPRL
jgi:hypothetical protein